MVPLPPQSTHGLTRLKPKIAINVSAMPMLPVLLTTFSNRARRMVRLVKPAGIFDVTHDAIEMLLYEVVNPASLKADSVAYQQAQIKLDPTFAKILVHHNIPHTKYFATK